LVAGLLRVARVTAGLAESNGSLSPGLRLTSPAGWLPRTGISSGTLRSVIEYWLPFYGGGGIIMYDDDDDDEEEEEAEAERECAK